MGTQNPSAPSCAASPVPANVDPSVAVTAAVTATVDDATAAVARPGIVHANIRHTSRFTVVGNHLAQHRGLTLTAIGLALHIQSLPAGAKVTIKALAARFPEGETRIAAALRELETHGYLARIRKRLPSGRIVTHTISYNQPRTAITSASEPPQAPEPPQTSVPPPAPASTPAPDPLPEPAKTPAPTAAPAPAPRPVPREPLPEPRTHDLERHRTAAALLAELRRHEPRLLLAERDVRRLAPAAAAWLERGATPDAVRHALTARVPDDLKHPAALLAHRLTALLPSPLPPSPAAVRPAPFQTCEGCDRAFRAAEPGHCRDCRPDNRKAA
ncbi:helix-turn-helix domain-containing protein [Streptomyces sp. NPDC001339]|uniref:helix-turn-helix domain-containing protein n=1 Tax=Streptomyces sp. NPDC001339 TaxID=3364563 RepID=UPI0036C79171